MLVELEQFGAEQPPIAAVQTNSKAKFSKRQDSLAGNEAQLGTVTITFS